MSSRFLQIHFLTSYPASLLNRDDVGFAKRIPFGGAVRTRISSQCLKRHWRTFEGENSLKEVGQDEKIDMSIRSRRTFEELMYEPLKEEGLDSEMVRDVTREIMAAVLGQSPSKADSDEESVRTGQVTVFGRPEIRYLTERARAACEAMRAAEEDGEQLTAKNAVKAQFDNDGKKNLAELEYAQGLDAALFGRMVTSDILARGDAAIHVAHALTVHEESTETDYFSAVDDLLAMSEEETLGSGHIGNAELTSGLYYGYLVVDVPLLVSNLEGVDRSDWQSADRQLASEVVRRLVHIVATVSPGAKLGSTAPYSSAHLVMAESGDVQPRTLANAFLEPVTERPSVVKNAYGALAGFLEDSDRVYGRRTERRLAGIGQVDLLAEHVDDAQSSLADVAGWAAAHIDGS